MKIITEIKESVTTHNNDVIYSDCKIKRIPKYPLFLLSITGYNIDGFLCLSLQFRDFGMQDISSLTYSISINSFHAIFHIKRQRHDVNYCDKNTFYINISTNIDSVDIEGISVGVTQIKLFSNIGIIKFLFPEQRKNKLEVINYETIHSFTGAKMWITHNHINEASEILWKCRELYQNSDQYLRERCVKKTAIDETAECFVVPIKCYFDKDFYCSLYATRHCAILQKELSYGGTIQYNVVVDNSDLEYLSLLYYLTIVHRGHVHYLNSNQDELKKYIYAKHPIFTLKNYVDDILGTSTYAASANQINLSNFLKEETSLADFSNQLSGQYFSYLNAQRNQIWETVTEKYKPYKWSSEFKLYFRIKHIFPDTIFQYSSEWLYPQSLDILVPSLSAGIEYQGAQHYYPIDHFGGETQYRENVIRDQQKKDKCFHNGITLIEWDCNTPIVFDNIIDTLVNSGFLDVIDTPSVRETILRLDITTPQEILELSSSKLADRVQYIKPKENKTPCRTTSTPMFVIRQYSTNGILLNEFDTVSLAAEQTSVSERSIKKCIYGERKTGGGFLWQRVARFSDKCDIDTLVIEQPDREGKSILQYDLHDKLIAEFPSLRQAANATGVNQRGISDVLKGIQKTAGGFRWRYKESCC